MSTGQKKRRGTELNTSSQNAGSQPPKEPTSLKESISSDLDTKEKNKRLSSTVIVRETNQPSNIPTSSSASNVPSGKNLFGFLDLKTRSNPPSSNANNISEFNISTPTNFQQKTHVDTNWNWSGDDVASQFVLYEKLGSGAYGTVYRCVHQSSNKELAAKVIPLTKNESVDIMKEVDVLKSCNHPSIVQYFGSCTTDGSLWILMDYCGQGSLADILRRCNKQRCTEEQISCILIGVLKGLSYLHSKGIIHRDLKAGNILLTDSGDIKIADFGVSAKINNKLSKTRTVIGTPLYMAPEMFDGVNYDFKADIWSLGITIIELAQGKPPHYDASPMQVILLISSGDPPTFDEPNDFSDSFKEFLSLCVQMEPHKRLGAELLYNHGFVQQTVQSKDCKSIIQELASQNNNNNNSSDSSETKSQGTSSPRSSISDGGGIIEEAKLLDDRYMPESTEELKLLVLQLRHRIKSQSSLTTQPNKNKGNEELVSIAKKTITEIEAWKKTTRKLEDELKEIIKKDKRIKEST